MSGKVVVVEYTYTKTERASMVVPGDSTTEETADKASRVAKASAPATAQITGLTFWDRQ
jgi:hypothetical protein